MQKQTDVLASDIDNTLTGDDEALAKLSTAISSLQKTGRLFLVLSTGRRLEQVIEGMQEENLPEPNAVISQVGTEIYLPPFTADTPALDAWTRKLHQEFDREQALQYVQNVDGLEMQPEIYNTPLKVSCFLDKAPDAEKAVADIRARVTRGNSGCQVIWSSSKHLDIIPSSAGKGKAIRFLLAHQQIAAQKVIVAGDSGNDRSMFEEFGTGIVVANAQAELKALREEQDAVGRDYYFATASYAAGVREGLQHFGVL